MLLAFGDAFLTVLVVTGSFVVLLGLLYLLAKNDQIIGFVPEGEIKAVMAGESLAKFIANVKGYDFAPKTWDLKKVGTGEEEIPRNPAKERWNKFRTTFLFGIYWVGFPPFFKRVLWYDFAWTKLTPEKESKAAILKPRSEKVNSVFFRYPYAALIGEEVPLILSDNVQVKITLLITVEVVNPEITLFKLKPAGNWINLLMAKVEEATRDWCGGKDLMAVRQAKEKAKKKRRETAPPNTTAGAGTEEPDFRDKIIKELKDLPQLCGVKIISVEFRDLELVGELLKSFQEKVVAVQKAEGVKAAADGKAYETEKLGGAVAGAVRARYAAMKETGGDQAFETYRAEKEAEALQQTKVTTLIWGGGRQATVQPMLMIPTGKEPSAAPAPSPASPPEKKE